MRKMKLLILLQTLFCSTYLSAAPIQTIHFATEATYPPFEYIDASGQMQGFDIDLARALCQQIKAQCTFSNQSFDSLIPSLQIGKYDALIAAIGITPEREKEVAFTNSYYEPSASFVAPTKKHYTLVNIDGRTIGVQRGTTFENYLKDKYSDKITVKNYSSIQDAFLDLIAGRVDMVLADTPIAQTWLNENKTDYMVVDQPIVDHQYFGTGYGIAVQKDNTNLLQALNQALTVIQQNGTYNKIMSKYFKK